MITLLNVTTNGLLVRVLNNRLREEGAKKRRRNARCNTTGKEKVRPGVNVQKKRYNNKKGAINMKKIGG